MTERVTISSVSTMPNPENTAPATKYGGKSVACQPGEDGRRRFVARPRPRRAVPPKAQEAVCQPSEARRRAISQRREIRDHAQIPDHQGDRQIRVDREQ